MNTAFERTTSEEDWITPPFIIEALTKDVHFNLDPCASLSQPHPYASQNRTADGLLLPWFGRVWCNPPYGNKTIKFIERLAQHNHGMALIFTRCDTQCWHKFIFPKATAILFLEGRLKFLKNGVPAKEGAGCGSALIAYGEQDRIILERAVEDKLLKGYFIKLR